jgi:hypothetical protein
MIIGINGKIGSGKDTIGSIIQYIVCLHKNTLAENQKDFEDFQKAPVSNSLQSGWEIKKFAGKLKLIGSILSGVPVEKFEDQEFKKQEMSEEWWYKNVYDAGWDKKWTKESVDYPTSTSTESHIVKTTYRQFLQNLGTEAMRDGLHTNVWDNALFADYTHGFPSVVTGKYDETIPYPNWIITDMRFPNELQAIEEREGITIRVTRPVESYPENPNFNGDMQIAVKMAHSHPSETALDDAEFDYEIINDGTIEDLIEKVKEILIKEQII